MKANEIIKKEEPKEMTLERARELLGDVELTDEELKPLLENIRIFCELVHDIYAGRTGKQGDNHPELNHAA
ncbi:MAG: hypothetical protein ACHQRM_17160 [Bacteroidia bacterium]